MDTLKQELVKPIIKRTFKLRTSLIQRTSNDNPNVMKSLKETLIRSCQLVLFGLICFVKSVKVP